MSEIKRYDAMMPYMRAATDGDFVLFSDHESDCERRVADAVAAERERCIKAMVEPLMEAAMYAEDCLNPQTDPRSSDLALYKLQRAIAAVKKAMKEKL